MKIIILFNYYYRFFICIFLTVLFSGLQVVYASQLAPKNNTLINSPWQSSHAGPAQQASSPLRGPESNDRLMIQQHSFKGLDPTDSSKGFYGASPWHVLSSKKYPKSFSNARTIWGATLTHLYKYTINGDVFEFADYFRIDKSIFTFHWNLIGLDNDRIIVPAPAGYKLNENRGQCLTKGKRALLEFRDGDQPNSSIQCVRSFELLSKELEKVCGNDISPRRTHGPQNMNVLYSGDIVITLNEKKFGQQRTFIVVIDNGLKQLKSCALLDDSAVTNQFPVEANDMFFATGTGIIKYSFNSEKNVLIREWKKDFEFRARTGTTPTLMGFGEGNDRLVAVVDSTCYVKNPLTGRIICDPDNKPSRLIVFKRDNDNNKYYSIDLPGVIKTVENSPAAIGYNIVIANYAGFKPEPDAQGGVVKLHWNKENNQFVLDWINSSILLNGVPTISGGSSVVYSTGIAEDGFYYFYGLDMNSGQLVVGRKMGKGRSFLDQGNNIILNDDRSLIYGGLNGIVRIKPK